MTRLPFNKQKNKYIYQSQASEHFHTKYSTTCSKKRGNVTKVDLHLNIIAYFSFKL